MCAAEKNEIKEMLFSGFLIRKTLIQQNSFPFSYKNIHIIII
jgi:hypothetical protein